MGSQKGLAMVYRENVVRFFHPFDHRGPIYLYVYVIFGLMAPWSALLPAALVETHSLRHADAEPARADRFALVYFWATFIFFTLSGSRRSYYILPILPAAAILVARTLAYPGELRSTDRPPPADRRLRDRRIRRGRRHRPADSRLGDSAEPLRRATRPARQARVHRVLDRIGRRGHLHDSQIQPVSRRDFDGRDRLSRDDLHLYLRDARGGGLSR